MSAHGSQPVGSASDHIVRGRSRLLVVRSAKAAPTPFTLEIRRLSVYPAEPTSSICCMRSQIIFYALCPLYLASSSPRRIDFFNSLGLPVIVLSPPEQAEPLPIRGEEPESYALRAAAGKASAVLDLLPPSPEGSCPIVIAADTIVVLRNRILGKPRDTDEAFAMLSLLAGQTHTVITGCTLLSSRFPEPRSFAVSSSVSMWACPAPLLKSYAESGEPLDKAGAYAVQGAGAFLISRIEGSWSNVVGLPLAEMIETLLELQAIIPVSES